VLLHIGVPTGQAAPVNSVLAIIGEAGEDISAVLANAAAGAPGAATAAPVAETAAPVAEPVAAEPVAQAEPAAPAPVAQAPVSDNTERVLASPLAKKLAAERGISIEAVAGTGENGRIVKRDIDHYVPYTPAANTAPYVAAPAGTISYTDEPISQMRKTIARRLAESKFTAPHFYLTLDIDMDAAIATRKSLNTIDGVKVSFNDMVIKAVAMALRKHPAINSAWMGDFIRRNEHVNIVVAVAVDEGLLVPVVRFADSKGLTQIAAEVREYAQKAKDKKLQPADWEGNTFTISNLGMFGIESFTAIVNPPDACILAIGGIKEVPVVKNGQVVPGNVMKVTLSCDHRVVDGASGAAFLQTFKTYMEQPAAMLL
ncbi:MAG: dihydrolipoamide acetyltransferase family protein, partial [Flavobacteriales bacterium]